LGEIESVLRKQDTVGQVAVVVREDAHLGEQLVAYLVPDREGALDLDAVKSSAAQGLPSYMVPTAWVVLEALPLNINGKLDRKALPAPVFEAVAFRAPVTPVEQTVAAVFAEVLGVERVGLDDDFFALGGNSLVATQVTARLGAALDAQVPVRMVFEASTVAGLAAAVESHAGSGARVALSARPRPERVPLSLAQQRMWFLNRFDSGTAVNNIPVALRLSGELDVAALAAAVTDVIARHEVLRTCYPEIDGVGRQVVLPVAEAPVLQIVRISADSVTESVSELIGTGFDVTIEVPFRAALLELSSEERILVLVAHHISADGFSMGPLARDVMVAYAARSRGGAPSWAPLEVQYADFALWQREVLGDENDPESLISAQLAYWSEALSGTPDVLDLPTDRPRPVQATHRGDTHRFVLPADVFAAVEAFASEQSATPFMVVHAAFAVLLARLSGTEDIVIGSPVAGRGEAALDDLVGMFVNTAVLRTIVDGSESFRDLLGRVREGDLGAFGHADVPFERLVDKLDPVRSQAHSPIFQVVLAFQNLASGTFELGDLSVAPVEADARIAKFDLQLTVVPGERSDGGTGGVPAMFDYATDLFDDSTIAAFADRFVRLLEALTRSPERPVGDADLFAPGELDGLLAHTGPAGPEPRTLPGLIAAAVAANPDGIAVRCEDRELTYRELDERSSQLARVLLRRGIGAEQLVAVAIPRSIESVLAVWAVTKTGAAFVPVDANYPADRIEHMVTDAQATTGLTLARHVRALPGDTDWLVLDDAGLQTSIEEEAATPVAETELLRPIRVGQVAYVIYTSGSTGKPKGVSVTHAGLHNFCVEQRERYRPGPDSRILHVSSPSFDASMLELLLALGAASTMVVSPATVFGGAELAELIRRERVSHAFITPSVLASMDPAGLDSLQHLVAGGEAVPADVVARWSHGRSLYNGYGPTETTIMANISEPMVPGAPITIGGPIRGMREVVLDGRLRPVPVGVVGELYISGIQLARGYHARGALTADRFVADPYGAPGERMYRTGDVVRWTPDGEIAYVGRSDHQVKIRGLRVELDEIDTVLVSHESVDFAATVGHDTPTGGTAVVSYVVPAAGAVVDSDTLREFAATSLPAHMVPAVVIALDTIPLTPVGKLDRRALPEPVFEARAFRAPSTPIEEIVAGVFADVLGVDRVGADDDFFDLGGNSLIATQVAARLGAALDTTVPVRELFEAPAVAALAARLESLAGGGGRAPLVAGARPEIVPLSLAQQRMWFLNRFDPASGSYNIPLAIRLSGALDVAALQGAVGDVIARHEILRTVYPERDGSGHQVVLPVADALPDLTPERVGADELPDRVRALASAGFDVTDAVPVRTGLFAVGETEHVLVLVMHHISGDGFSLGPLTRDVMVAYTERAAGRLPVWAPLPVQYADFALWQREVLGTEDDPDSPVSGQLGYWRETLAGLSGDLELPTDRPRPAMPSMAGGYHAFTLEPELHRGLTELARAHNTSMFMVVHAALAVLLARLTGGRDIAVGTGVAGRGEPELDDLIGMFVNTLVLRTDVDPSRPFGDLVDRARETDLSAFANADVPFERLVEVLDPARSSGRHPFFQVMLSLQNFRPVSFELPGLTISGLDTGEVAAKFDLMLTLEGTYDEAGEPDRLIAGFTYATDLFEAATVERFAERFTRIVEAVVAKPDVTVGDIDILGAAERAQFQPRPADTETEPGAAARNLVSVLMSTVESDPEAPAVADGEGEVSYAALDARSSRAARYLLGRGVGAGSRVGIRLPRSVERVVAVWAVLKTGAAVVLLDDAETGVESGADVVLGAASGTAAPTVDLDDPGTVSAIEAEAATPVTYADLARPIQGGDPAFVLGAGTGRERMIGHAAAADTAARLAARAGVDYESRTHVHGPAGSEAAVLELVAAVTAGAALVAPQERAASFDDELADQWVTHLFVGSQGAPRFDDGVPEDLAAVVFVDVQPEPGYADLLGDDGPELFTDVVVAERADATASESGSFVE
uniref:non-ribosomal peptide synthetase n=1 Tax=Rhodococcus phenolicus TaxID=263849 RepID=UPI0012E901C1